MLLFLFEQHFLFWISDLRTEIDWRRRTQTQESTCCYMLNVLFGVGLAQIRASRYYEVNVLTPVQMPGSHTKYITPAAIDP